jgi:hypothetical protein
MAPNGGQVIERLDMDRAFNETLASTRAMRATRRINEVGFRLDRNNGGTIQKPKAVPAAIACCAAIRAYVFTSYTRITRSEYPINARPAESPACRRFPRV